MKVCKSSNGLYEIELNVKGTQNTLIAFFDAGASWSSFPDYFVNLLGLSPNGNIENVLDANGVMVMASETKNLVPLCDKVMPFPPGHYYKDGEFVCYRDLTKVDKYSEDDLEATCKNIHDKLVAGIEKRLIADAKVGFLLSGGLDSSLVCAVAAKASKKPIKTFAIGMNEDAIDLKYAKQVADYIHSDHKEIIITKLCV